MGFKEITRKVPVQIKVSEKNPKKCSADCHFFRTTFGDADPGYWSARISCFFFTDWLSEKPVTLNKDRKDDKTRLGRASKRLKKCIDLFGEKGE